MNPMEIDTTEQREMFRAASVKDLMASLETLGGDCCIKAKGPSPCRKRRGEPLRDLGKPP